MFQYHWMKVRVRFLSCLHPCGVVTTGQMLSLSSRFFVTIGVLGMHLETAFWIKTIWSRWIGCRGRYVVWEPVSPVGVLQCGPDKRRSEDSVLGSIFTDYLRSGRLMLADVSWTGFPLHLTDRERAVPGTGLWLLRTSAEPSAIAGHHTCSDLSSFSSGA